MRLLHVQDQSSYFEFKAQGSFIIRANSFPQSLFIRVLPRIPSQFCFRAHTHHTHIYVCPSNRYLKFYIRQLKSAKLKHVMYERATAIYRWEHMEIEWESIGDTHIYVCYNGRCFFFLFPICRFFVRWTLAATHTVDGYGGCTGTMDNFPLVPSHSLQFRELISFFLFVWFSFVSLIHSFFFMIYVCIRNAF